MPLRLSPPANPPVLAANSGANPLAEGAQARAKPLAAAALAALSLGAAAGVGFLFLETARDAWGAVAAAGPAGPADGILLVVGGAGALMSVWLGLGLSVSALAALPGALGQISGVLAARIAPAAARTLVACLLGSTLTGALVPGAAFADSGNAVTRPALFAMSQIAFGPLTGAGPDISFQRVSDAASAEETAPTPSWSPDRPPPPKRSASPGRASSSVRRTAGNRQASPQMSASPEVPALSGARGADTGDVRVHRGDSLWSIAAHRLGPGATSSDIDAEWHRWFAANRKVIGNDANVIEPGQVLSMPASTEVRSSPPAPHQIPSRPASPQVPQ